jgi:hypothetical protein
VESPFHDEKIKRNEKKCPPAEWRESTINKSLMEEKVAELEDLAQQLAEQRRVRSVEGNETEDEEGSSEEDEDEGEELEKNELLRKLEQIRDNLKDSIRKSKDERATKLARVYECRLKIEHLNNQLACPSPRTPSSTFSSLHLVPTLSFALRCFF